jgi:hypothetical protein
MANVPNAATAEGLSKLTVELPGWPKRVTDVAGDFLNCCGDDRGPRGVSPVTIDVENGVETGGVAAAP